MNFIHILVHIFGTLIVFYIGALLFLILTGVSVCIIENIYWWFKDKRKT